MISDEVVVQQSILMLQCPLGSTSGPPLFSQPDAYRAGLHFFTAITDWQFLLD